MNEFDHHIFISLLKHRERPEKAKVDAYTEVMLGR